MQHVVIDRPYRFIPPVRGTAGARVLTRLVLPHYLRAKYGVTSWAFFGVDRLRESVRQGHGILLTPNHCRACDPMVLFPLGLDVGAPLHVMASWHVFMEGRLRAWVLRRMGVFSVYREGMDREALRCATEILTEARRPLVLFPEGVISRSNDRLNHLMDGTVLIARAAAKARAAQTPPGRVVLHPVAIRYFFGGDVAAAVEPVLERIEHRLSWHSQADKALRERIIKVGEALLTLKELEYCGHPQPGGLAERTAGLIDRLLVPLEQEWLRGKREGTIVLRVKALRAAILPEMVAERIEEAERKRRWRQLGDIHLAQQVASYPPDYFRPAATPERLLETVERFEEDLTDEVTVHRPIHAAVEVGEAIEIAPGRARGAEADTTMTRVRQSLEEMLERLRERRPQASRSATRGSTRLARRAGSTLASVATATSRADAAT